MNLALTDPFILAQDYPEALTGKLSMITAQAHPRLMLTTHGQDPDTQHVFDLIAEGTSLLQAAYATARVTHRTVLTLVTRSMEPS